MSRLRRAQAAMELGRWSEGGRLVTEHLAEFPDDAEAHCLLAQARLGLADPAGALVAANTAVGLDPDAEWPHRLASLALGQLGQRQEALRAAHVAASHEPEAWQTRVRLAETLSRVRRHHEAWAEAMAAVSLAPYESRTHRAAGDAALAAGWLDQAEYAYRRALEIDPDDPAAINDLGVVDERRGKLTSAIGRFTSSARLDPTDAVSPRNVHVMGWRLMRLAALGAIPVVLLSSLTVAFDDSPGWSGTRAVGGLLGLLVLGGGFGTVWWRLPRVARPVLQRMVTRSLWGWVWLTVLALDVAVLLARPWTGANVGTSLALYGGATGFFAASAGSRRAAAGDAAAEAAEPPTPYGWMPGAPPPDPTTRDPTTPDPTTHRALSWRRRDRHAP